MFDRESLFQMLAQKDWDGLSELIYQQRSVLTSDPVIGLAVKLFEQEFLGHVRSLSSHDRVVKLKHISLLIEVNRDSFAENFVNEAIDLKLAALHDTESTAFPGYASQYVDRPLAQQLLLRTRDEKPEKIAEARRPFVTVKAGNTARRNLTKTIKLFKSEQERNFFVAVQKTFPSYLPYPNVAVSAVIDFEAVKGALTATARGYFFKAMFDCVLFDPTDGHQPVHFFELDSKFHDTTEAKTNDRLKNEICVAANVKLIRIRAFDTSERTVEAFSGLVRELVQPTEGHCVP